jgi:hypothetical protein
MPNSASSFNVFFRRGQDQMKYLSAALQKAIQNNQENYLALSNTVEKMVAVVEKLADALRPAASDSPSLSGHPCRRIDPFVHGTPFTMRDPENKRILDLVFDQGSEDASPCIGVISEFDMADGTCLVSLKGERDRIPAVVLDPRFSLPNNPYVEAMSAVYALPMIARLERDESGNLVKVFIVDTSEPGLDFVWR